MGCLRAILSSEGYEQHLIQLSILSTVFPTDEFFIILAVDIGRLRIFNTLICSIHVGKVYHKEILEDLLYPIDIMLCSISHKLKNNTLEFHKTQYCAFLIFFNTCMLHMRLYYSIV